jgi:FkbM family methyltransferase
MTRTFKLYALGMFERFLLGAPRLRRLAWRVGRSLYCLARGEQRVDDMRFDGELDLQRRVLDANRAAPHFVAFDVGANHGEWTLALVDAFSTGEDNADRLEAHVFEPVPAARDRLTDRLKAAGVGERCRINAAAASDKPGVLEMIVMSESGGTNSLVYDEAMAKQAIGFVSVPVTTLDLYCSKAGIDHIHIVKCDTEGHDLSVIRGAIGLLGTGSIDVFQFEYNHRWITARAYLKDVFDLIDGLPYRLGRIMPYSVELFDTWHPELERYYQSNYVLVSNSAPEALSMSSGLFDAANVFVARNAAVKQDSL